MVNTQMKLGGVPCRSCPAKEDTWRKENEVIFVACILALCIGMFLLNASAIETNAIVDGITGGAKKIYEILESVLLPLAIVSFAWNGLKMLMGDQREMSAAKKHILITVIVILLVLLAPPIIEEVQSWFETGHWNDVF